MDAKQAALRLLLPAMVLPAVIVLSDEWALRLASAKGWSAAATFGVLVWFVVQTALLSYVAGWRLPNWPWRLVLLGWALLLVNLLLPASTSYAAGIWRVEVYQRMLGRAFAAGEISSLAIWLILGASSPIRRLGLVTAASLPVFYLFSALRFPAESPRWAGNDAWIVIILVQTAGIGAMAMLLRLQGFRIGSLSFDPRSPSRGPVQFSVRHLFVATTIVAILVFAAQWAMIASSHTLVSGQWVQASVYGALLALVSLAAVWMALGAGRWPLRLFVFAVMAACAGACLTWLETHIRYGERWGQLVPLTDMQGRWPSWTLLAGSFLASMLLVLRGTGCRLAKRASIPSAA